MSELDLIERCAKAMGFRTHRVSDKVFYCPDEQTSIPKGIWNPLKDDFQAMAMVKKLGINFTAPTSDDKQWYAWTYRQGEIAEHASLNRALCECVAKLTTGEAAPQSINSTQDNQGEAK